MERMKRVDGIRIFEDRAFQSWMAGASLAVIGIGLALGVLGFLLLRPSLASEPSGIVGIGLSILALIGIFALHELIHGAFFKLFAPAGSRVAFGANWRLGMLYTSAEGIVYTRRQYQAIIIAPTIAVTALLLAAGMMSGWFLTCYVLAVAHLSGCTGDWGYLLALARDPEIDRCEDMSWGVRFYRAGEPAKGDGER